MLVNQQTENDKVVLERVRNFSLLFDIWAKEMCFGYHGEIHRQKISLGHYREVIFLLGYHYAQLTLKAVVRTLTSFRLQTDEEEFILYSGR